MSNSSSKSSNWDKQRQFIEHTIVNRLDDRPAWPKSVFRLELESAGIYQDRSSSILDKLIEENVVSEISLRLNGSDTNSIPFIARPEQNPPEPDEEIKEATAKLNAFYQESSDFSELTTYTALCKVHDELSDHITAMEVLPSNNYPLQLGGFRSQIDALMRINSEYIPVEVYNGSDYLSPKDGDYLSDKFKQIRDRYSDENPVSNPMLINRRSDGDFKEMARKKFNTVVVDTGIIVGCEETHPEINRISNLFNLKDVIKLLPPLETSEDETLDGAKYHTVSRSNNRAEIIRPMTKMVDAAESLPDQYVERIRGGVQLHYVNMFYRSTSDRTKRDASLVLQEIYNLILREQGMDRNKAVNKGWENFLESYRHVKSAKQRRDEIVEKTEDFINAVRDANVIFEKDGKIHPRKATHPQQGLSFW